MSNSVASLPRGLKETSHRNFSTLPAIGNSRAHFSTRAAAASKSRDSDLKGMKLHYRARWTSTTHCRHSNCSRKWLRFDEAYEYDEAALRRNISTDLCNKLLRALIADGQIKCY